MTSLGTVPDHASMATDAQGRLVLRRVRVRVVSGPAAGVERLLEHGSLLVGSSPVSDFPIADRRVSRSHLEISLVASGIRLRDLGSTNGTFVGDSRIESVVVRPVVEVRLGAETRIEMTPADVPAPMPPSSRACFGRLVGTSPPMRRLFAILERVARSDVPLSIEGEAGAGKSEAAAALHALSARARGRLEVIDLRSAWDPADLDACFERAQGGTVVLDHLDTVARPLGTHLSALVDLVERGEADVRVIATSRSDLRGAVEEGHFPRDLYFQIVTVRAVVPPLRERLSDIELLLRALVRDLTGSEEPLPAEALGRLRVVDFPGNVRELRNRLEEHLALSPDRRSGPTSSRLPTTARELDGLAFKDAKEQLVDSFEEEYVRRILERHRGNVSRAAAEAGISRNHLMALARKHDLR